MSRDTNDWHSSTRRDYVKYGCSVLSGGLLAGCSGSADSTPSPDTDEPTGTTVGTTTEAAEDTPYSVTMAPVGEVTFEHVPQRWLPYDPGFADMGVALGHGEGMTGIGQAQEYHTSYYSELPGVGVDRNLLENNDLVAAGMSKELFYELESDVHVIDPVFLQQAFDWTEDDVTEIRENVAPFLGNRLFRRSDEWHDYRYYTMYQAFEKMA
jgi:iron complex transport system substrate-binding protein